MRHKFPVLTVKKWLKSMHIYGSYRKNKQGYRFWTTLYFLPVSPAPVSVTCVIQSWNRIRLIPDSGAD